MCMMQIFTVQIKIFMIQKHEQIIGHGIDIVKISRIEEILQKYSVQFIKKIFSEMEIEALYEYKKSINSTQKITQYIANRFSAKESVVKAIGTGFSNNIAPKDIQITKNSFNKPSVTLSNNAINTIGNLLNHHKLHNSLQIYLSISDEKEYSITSTIITITSQK